MEMYVYWFLMALVMLGLEMASGTFYLLVLSISMMLGGSAAYYGVSLEVQLIVCTLGVVFGVLILRKLKPGQIKGGNSASLDIGQPVQVLTWHQNGSARVFYRGTEWDAELDSADIPRDGALFIVAVRGSVLILTNIKPQLN